MTTIFRIEVTAIAHILLLSTRRRRELDGEPLSRIRSSSPRAHEYVSHYAYFFAINHSTLSPTVTIITTTVCKWFEIQCHITSLANSTYQKSHWSPALCLPTTTRRIPIMAIRWHLGIFPISSPILRQQPRYSHYQTQLLLLQKSCITKTEQQFNISPITWFLQQQRNPHSTHNEVVSVPILPHNSSLVYTSISPTGMTLVFGRFTTFHHHNFNT